MPCRRRSDLFDGGGRACAWRHVVPRLHWAVPITPSAPPLSWDARLRSQWRRINGVRPDSPRCRRIWHASIPRCVGDLQRVVDSDTEVVGVVGRFMTLTQDLIINLRALHEICLHIMTLHPETKFISCCTVACGPRLGLSVRLNVQIVLLHAASNWSHSSEMRCFSLSTLPIA